MKNMGVPSKISVLLGALATVLTVLNQVSFGFSAPWREAATIGLSLGAFFGISPLTKEAFRSVLHIGPRIGVALGSTLPFVQVGVGQLGVGRAAVAAIQGVVACALALLVAPEGQQLHIQTVEVPVPTPRDRPTSEKQAGITRIGTESSPPKRQPKRKA